MGCRPYILQGIAKRPYIHTNKQPTLYGELSDVPSMYFKFGDFSRNRHFLILICSEEHYKDNYLTAIHYYSLLVYLFQRKTAPIWRAVKIRLVYTLKSWRFLQDKTYHCLNYFCIRCSQTLSIALFRSDFDKSIYRCVIPISL